jgi:hypothetical protein
MARVDLSFRPDHSGLEGCETVPPRSRLFAMAPIGIGTPGAEGLISYIIRLAEAYSVSPRRLILEEFAKVRTELAMYRRHGSIFHCNARSINGLHQFSAMFADVIDTLCGIGTARYMTLIPLGRLLPFNGKLLASSPRWCPACYAEMLKSTRVLYQPLAWSFDLYRICARHGTMMVDRCPSCGELQEVIPRTPTIGWCSNCGSWLGKQPDVAAHQDHPINLWVANAIEEIVAALPRVGRLATRHRFVRQLDRAIQQYTHGCRRRFCLGVGLPEGAFQRVLGAGQRPTFALWLTIAYGLGVSPIQFLEMHFDPWGPHPPLSKLATPLSTKMPRICLTPEQARSIAEELGTIADTEESPVSVAALAERLGVTRSLVRHRWPDLCHRISSNYRKLMRIRAQRELLERCRITVEAVDQLMWNGIYPSQKTVRAELERRGISFANPDLHAVYRQRVKSLLGK